MKRKHHANCSVLTVGHSRGDNSDCFPHKRHLRTRLILSWPWVSSSAALACCFHSHPQGHSPSESGKSCRFVNDLLGNKLGPFFLQTYINQLFQAAWAFTSKIFPQCIKEYLVLWVSGHHISYFILTVNKCFVYLENIALFCVIDRPPWVWKVPFS